MECNFGNSSRGSVTEQPYYTSFLKSFSWFDVMAISCNLPCTTKLSLHPQYCRSDFPHSFASSSRWNQHLGFFFFAIKISYQCYQKHWASCLAAQSNYWDTHQFFRSLYLSNILWSLVFLTYQQISLSLEPPLASFKKQRYLMSNPSALSHSICGLFCFGKVHFNEAEARGGIIVTAQLCEMYICCENLYLICCLWRLAVL